MHSFQNVHLQNRIGQKALRIMCGLEHFHRCLYITFYGISNCLITSTCDIQCRYQHIDSVMRFLCQRGRSCTIITSTIQEVLFNV